MIILRRATPEDSTDLLRWRNEAYTRGMSRNTDVIPEADHAAWLTKVLASTDHQLWIGLHNGTKIGIVRFARQEDGWELSIMLDPRSRGQGLGKALAKKGLEALLATQGRTNVLAVAAEYNVASVRLFESLQFKRDHREDQFIHFIWDLNHLTR